jgi:predicted Zn-dependent peptidase
MVGRASYTGAMRLLILSSALTLYGGAASAAPVVDPHVVNEKYTLDNGLEVILHQDNRVPLAFVMLWYHVGSGDEAPGHSGFARLLESMMFEGTLHTGDDAHVKILEKVGGSDVSGDATTDRTRFFEQVPANELETALWLESDRMGFLVDNLQGAELDNQRDLAGNERRQRYDDVAYGAARAALYKSLYADGHPYRNLTIGLADDLKNASLADVKAFFHRWYAPSNATLVIAGDFQSADAKALVAKWFGPLPKLPRPDRKMVPPTPVASPQRQVVNDPFAKLRRLEWAWHSPADFAAGDAELEILANALGRDGTGRLYKRLVVDKPLAQSVSVYQQGMRMSGFFHVSVTLRDNADAGEVEKIVQDEIARVTKDPITQEELDRVVAAKQADTWWSLESLEGRAELLESCDQATGVPDCVSADLDRYRNTTVEKVRDAAASTLNPKTVVEIVTNPTGVPGSDEKGVH